jgi:CCR4-NOT transcriptional regulation complex NOT5 subunit
MVGKLGLLGVVLSSMLWQGATEQTAQRLAAENVQKLSLESKLKKDIDDSNKIVTTALQAAASGCAPDQFTVDTNSHTVSITYINRTKPDCPSRTFSAPVGSLLTGRDSIDVESESAQQNTQLVEIHCTNHLPCFDVDPPIEIKRDQKPVEIEQVDNAFFRIRLAKDQSVQDFIAAVSTALSNTVVLSRIESTNASKFK